MSTLLRATRSLTENRSERAARTSSATDRLRKAHSPSSEASNSCPEGSLGRLWALLSGSWGALGRSWGALGALLGALGVILAALGALLGRSWALFGGTWNALVALWAASGRSWTIWTRFWSLRGLILESPEVDFRHQAERANRVAGMQTLRRVDPSRRQTDTRCERKARRVDPNRRHTARHPLRSKSSTTLS
jgi:hypothetical protein